MSKNKVKNLTMTDINKLGKKYNEQYEVTLQEQYKIKIDRYFKKTKIQDMIIELQEIMQELRKENVDINAIKDIIVIYQMLIIKHFTSLPLPKNISIKKMLAVYDKLIDTGLFEEILNNFPHDQIEFLNEELRKYKKIGEQMGELFVGMGLGNSDEGVESLEQIEEDIESKIGNVNVEVINKDKLN